MNRFHCRLAEELAGEAHGHFVGGSNAAVVLPKAGKIRPFRNEIPTATCSESKQRT
jgi:hypothetical protein